MTDYLSLGMAYSVYSCLRQLIWKGFCRNDCCSVILIYLKYFSWLRLSLLSDSRARRLGGCYSPEMRVPKWPLSLWKAWKSSCEP